MKEIKLTKGMVALVDDEDYERVGQYSWHVKMPCNVWYAYHLFHLDSGYYLCSMHRFILKLPVGKSGVSPVDHLDRNGLNNQKENLRICTPQENRANAPGCNGKYKGVTFRSNKNTWRASVEVCGRSHEKCGFSTAEEAARAYDKMAIEYFGEFTYLNFPSEKIK